MPAVTLPNGTNGSASCAAELSRMLMKTCVVRPFGTAKAKAIVPRTFDCTNGSSGNVRARQAFAMAGSPLMPNWTQRSFTARKNLVSS